jgi:hypothetical protein
MPAWRNFASSFRHGDDASRFDFVSGGYRLDLFPDELDEQRFLTIAAASKSAPPSPRWPDRRSAALAELDDALSAGSGRSER